MLLSILIRDLVNTLADSGDQDIADLDDGRTILEFVEDDIAFMNSKEEISVGWNEEETVEPIRMTEADCLREADHVAWSRRNSGYKPSMRKS